MNYTTLIMISAALAIAGWLTIGADGQTTADYIRANCPDAVADLDLQKCTGKRY